MNDLWLNRSTKLKNWRKKTFKDLLIIWNDALFEPLIFRKHGLRFQYKNVSSKIMLK